MRRERAVNEKDKASLGRWDAALSWYSKLRGADERELTSEVGRDWKTWYADAENRRIFDRVSRSLADRHRYSVPQRPNKTELEDDCYDCSVPIEEWLTAHRSRETEQRRIPPIGRWWWPYGAAVTAALVVLCVLPPLRFWFLSGSSSPTVYETRIGKLRNVHLRDGSTITLGGRTKLLVTFSPQRRSINLVEGQAWFTVAHDSRWPFVVAAGDGTITAVGTAFLVTRDFDRVVVTVTEGAVEVAARPPPPISPSLDQGALARSVLVPIRVKRGQELALRDNGILSHIRPADTQAATAWIHGHLTFDDQPLRYVIETVDRYSNRRIVVSPSAGGLRFTGVIFDDDIDEWIQSLEVIFPVTIEEQGAVVRIEMSTSTPAVRGVMRGAQP